MPGLHVPLSTLRGRPRMTQGRCGSLALHRTTLAFATPRRFNPAHKETAMAAKKIPEGHNRVSPYLIVDGAERALDFYKKAFGKKAFGAVELFRHTAPTGKVGHAEVRIGDTVIMLADVHPDFDAHSPAHYGGSPISLHMYVEDVDAVAHQAIAAGAKVKRPVA